MNEGAINSELAKWRVGSDKQQDKKGRRFVQWGQLDERMIHIDGVWLLTKFLFDVLQMSWYFLHSMTNI